MYVCLFVCLVCVCLCVCVCVCVCAVAPNITSQHERTTLLLDEGLVLPCTAEGFPVPSVSWTHNNTMLPECTIDIINSGTVCVETQVGSAGVLILFSEERDAGRYTCTAVNSAGVATYEVFVTVQRPTS